MFYATRADTDRGPSREAECILYVGSRDKGGENENKKNTNHPGPAEPGKPGGCASEAGGLRESPGISDLQWRGADDHNRNPAAGS